MCDNYHLYSQYTCVASSVTPFYQVENSFSEAVTLQRSHINERLGPSEAQTLGSGPQPGSLCGQGGGSGALPLTDPSLLVSVLIDRQYPYMHSDSMTREKQLFPLTAGLLAESSLWGLGEVRRGDTFQGPGGKVTSE